MVFCCKTFTFFFLVIQSGIFTHVEVASTETSEALMGAEEDVAELAQKSSAQFTEPIIEERNFFRKIRQKWDQVVDKAKGVLVWALLKVWHKNKIPEPCYGNIGCFRYAENMSLKIGGPQSPKEVDATFYFFKNGSEDLEKLLGENETTVIPKRTYSLENWTFESTKDTLNLNMPLMVVTHGLTGSKRTPWMLPLVKALLENVNCTVLVVDWEKGAAGSYPDAGINTPMAGALISFFLQNITKYTNDSIGPDNITLIGFSMGAQVMGFTGRHFYNYTQKKLRRIAGLDPAGWLYENTKATLTKSDAQYVDVIHTNAGSIKNFRIGLNQSVGHVDFYPNGGTVQTGCKHAPKIIPTNYLEVITCSHYKATDLFIESLTSRDCKFTSYGCLSWEDFKSGNCTKRVPANETGELGFYSYTAPGQGNQFLYTNAAPPYCRGSNTTPPE